MFVNNEPVTEEIKREIQKFLETNDNESTTQNLRDAAVQRRVYGNTILPQETRETSNIQPKFIPKRNWKRRTKTISRRKEIIKIRVEISEKEMKQ